MSLIRTVAATVLVTGVASLMLLSGRPEVSPPRTPGAFYLRLAMHVDGRLLGNQIWARNAQGWIAHAQSSPNRRPATRELLDGHGNVVLINDQVRARSTFDRVQRGQDPFGTPESGCTLTSDGRKMSGERIGETRLSGLRAIVFQKLDDAQERWTDWASPDLGCVVLRSVTEYRRTPAEPWKIVRYLTAAELIVDGYPAWIFTLTPDYREMSPMAVLRELGDTGAGLRMQAVENSYQANAARRRDPAYADSPSPAPTARP